MIENFILEYSKIVKLKYTMFSCFQSVVNRSFDLLNFFNTINYYGNLILLEM